MNGEKKEIPKGTLGLVELYCLSIGQVIGAGVITLVGPAITATGYSAWLAYSRLFLSAAHFGWEAAITPSLER